MSAAKPRTSFFRTLSELKTELLSSENYLRPESLKETLVLLLAARTVVLSLLLGFAAWELSTRSSYGMEWFFGVISFTYLVSAVNLLLLKKIENPQKLVWFQLATDLTLASLTIYLLGSSGSVLLYLLVIIEAAVLLGSQGAVITASASAFFYSIINSGLIPPAHGNFARLSPTEILMVYISLVTVALAASAVARQLGRVKRSASSSANELSKMELRQQQLFDDLQEGIITVDLDQAITSINQAASSIIGLTQVDANDLIGKSLQGILEDLGANQIDDLLGSQKLGISREISFRNESSGNSRFLSYNVKEIEDSEGNISGKRFIFNDVSKVKEMEEKLSLKEKLSAIQLDSLETSSGKELSDKLQIIGESPVMTKIFTLVDRVAKSEASVLINGQSGTGKELIAKAIHFGSERSEKPFVTLNCGAIPESLIESELFGHVKGAFTGAIKDSLGLFRQAEGGTIFLDEIGELPLHLQSKLLRALQERTVRPVGGAQAIDIDVRVLAATNKNLRSEIRDGEFREDLFYRLNVVNITLPPLKERKEDIPHLINYFTSRYGEKNGQESIEVSAEALHALNNYSYPGNIRELENIIERAVVLGGEFIGEAHLPPEVIGAEDQELDFSNQLNTQRPEEVSLIVDILPTNLDEELAKIEMNYLKSALEETGGAKKQAAQLLGLNFRSFRYRLKKYGLTEVGEHEENN